MKSNHDDQPGGSGLLLGAGAALLMVACCALLPLLLAGGLLASVGGFLGNPWVIGILAEEFLYARTWTSEDERANALERWNLHDNYHRPHGAADGQPPATLVPIRVNNVLASYS